MFAIRIVRVRGVFKWPAVVFFSDSDLKQIRETEIIKFLALRKIQFFARLPEKTMGKMHRVLGVLSHCWLAPCTPETRRMPMKCSCCVK